MDELKENGAKLLDLGYPIVPIMPGSKYPGFDGWQSTEANETLLAKWLSNGHAKSGVGVLTRTVPAVDLDVHDPEIIEQLIAWCEQHIGPTVQRVGRAPKTLLVYRTETPFRKVQSATYTDFLDQKHKVEILGDGQQFVAYAVHPDTQKPYTWTSAETLADVPRDSLPVITEAQARELVAYFESIIPADWVRVSEAATGKNDATPEDMRALRNSKPALNVTTEQLQECLNRIDADDYHVWVRVGMALYHQFDGGAEGLALWDAWSAKGSTYKAGEIPRKWQTFKANLTRPEPVTAATILHLGRAEEAPDAPKDPMLDAFLQRYVFVAADNGVIDMSSAPDETPIPWNAFRNAKANVWKLVEDTSPLGKPRTKKIPLSTIWLEHPKRKEVRRTGYAPGQPRIYEESRVRIFNTFHIPEHPETNRTDRLGVFHEHMAYLFPIEDEREWFVNFVARIVQHPEKRGMVTPLHISKGQGTGRGWLVKVVEALLGKWNCSATKMEALTGEGGAGNYQDYMHRTLFCSIGEVREGKKKYLVADMIRDRLTETRQGLNLKYGGYRTVDVYTNFFFMSNHSDALILPPEDRRINVFVCPHDPRPGEYYETLNKWREDPNAIAQLFHWLRKRDLSCFNWRTSIKNAARALMIENGQSETEKLFREMMEAPPAVAMTFSQISDHLSTLSEDPTFGIDQGQLRKLLQNNARQAQRIKVGGQAVRPWVLRADAPFTAEDVRRAVTGENEPCG